MISHSHLLDAQQTLSLFEGSRGEAGGEGLERDGDATIVCIVQAKAYFSPHLPSRGACGLHRPAQLP